MKRDVNLYVKDILEAMESIVWDTIKIEMPKLKPKIKEILSNIQRGRE